MLAFSSQRLVEGRGISQEGRDPFTVSRPPSGRSRQNRSHSIGHLELSPLPPQLLSPSLSHPSLDPHPLSVSPLPSLSSLSSCSEATTHLSALFFPSSSCFHSVEAATLQATGGAVVSQRQRCRSRSFGYLALLKCLSLCVSSEQFSSTVGGRRPITSVTSQKNHTLEEVTRSVETWTVSEFLQYSLTPKILNSTGLSSAFLAFTAIWTSCPQFFIHQT